MSFQKQFEDLKKLNLPQNDFVVVGSGPMSVRGIRESKDIDVIVTQSLWDELTKNHTTGINSWGVQNIELEHDIEILHPTQSMFGNSSIVPVEEVFGKADMFDGIKFISLEHLKKIKIKLGRDKDMEDVGLIDKFLEEEKPL